MPDVTIRHSTAVSELFVDEGVAKI